ncbi:MAG: phosphonate ABC transporter, permease protein PhnE [Pseudochelatococcus sp.]|jgi:phosphonate transport system permease protein|uniref:phosphonate ABC transporter, permease protein PhnE n=1 Tax=Pseudochelatococcus sp. TaxID=2020869 RepID=UPI003D93D4C3
MISNAPHSTVENALNAYFETARRDRFRQTLSGVALVVALLLAAHATEVTLTGLAGIPSGILNYFSRTLPAISLATLPDDIANWFWAFPKWMSMLLESLIMAWVATVLGVALALPLSFVAARNGLSSPFGRFVVWRIFQIARAVPEIVYALIFVFAFGPGALAGILAITVHAVGALGKLFAESHENVGANAISGIRSTGARASQISLHGVLPQSLPDIISYSLLRFESNVRASAIVGMVGAGGIGQELYFAIRQFHYTDISAIILMIIALVIIIDSIASRLRHKVIKIAAPGQTLHLRQVPSELNPSVIMKRNLGYRIRVVTLFILIMASIVASFMFVGVNAGQITNGLPRLGFLISHMFPPLPGARPLTLMGALFDTLAIAVVGTALSVSICLPLGFLGARNFVKNYFLHQSIRRLFDVLRSVDTLIWAIIFVGVVGLGPFAGVLAIAAADIGSLAKLFADAIENVDRRDVEAIKSTGASKVQEARFGYLPPVLPVMLSQSLYFFESNVRAASILGVVGAGGIGLYLSEALRIGEWQQLGFMIVLILLLVIVTEFACGFLLKRTQGRKA